MPRVSPTSKYVVVALPVFDIIVDQVEPPSMDLSILYPVMAEPPLSVGAVQLKLIWEEETVVAVSPVGGDGVAIGVVADAVVEGELVPIALIAETL